MFWGDPSPEGAFIYLTDQVPEISTPHSLITNLKHPFALSVIDDVVVRTTQAARNGLAISTADRKRMFQIGDRRMVRRETGRKSRMKEPYREGRSEALWPRVLRRGSRDTCRSIDSGTSGLGYRAPKRSFRAPTLSFKGEGNTGYSAKSQAMFRRGVVEGPRHVEKLSAREPGDLRHV
jgi:hypothetical protein